LPQLVSDLHPPDSSTSSVSGITGMHHHIQLKSDFS
jgi:hypothetical protein